MRIPNLKIIFVFFSAMFLAQCSHSVRASGSGLPLPVMLGPVERVGGKVIGDNVGVIVDLEAEVRNGITGNGNRYIIYDEFPETFGNTLLKQLPGSKIRIRMVEITSIAQQACHLVFFCGNNMNIIRGDAEILRK